MFDFCGVVLLTSSDLRKAGFTVGLSAIYVSRAAGLIGARPAKG